MLTEAGLLGEVAQRMQRTAQHHGLPADQTPWMNDGAPKVLLFRPAPVTPPLPRPPAPPAPPLQGLSELVDAFERQLAARQLDQPEDDCCVATLALMRHAGLGEAGLARYWQLVRQARQELPDPSPVPSPPGTPTWLKLAAVAAAGIGVVVLLALMAGGLSAASYPLVDGLPPDRVQTLQREAAARAGVGVEFSDRMRDGREGPKLMVIPAGQFHMGSESGDADERPMLPRRVGTFALMKTEVTVAQYLECVAAGQCREPEWRDKGSKYHYQIGSDDLYRKMGAALTDANSPVVGVDWENARQYAGWLTAQTGQKYRLASEAEWEYAARSGSTGRWSFGDDEGRLGQYARFSGNSQGRIWEVGGLQANAWGLHDIHGNVWEWVQECWHRNYQGAPETGAAWEAGCTETRRVVRGGSYFDVPGALRSANRSWLLPDDRVYDLGFRLARTL